MPEASYDQVRIRAAGSERMSGTSASVSRITAFTRLGGVS